MDETITITRISHWSWFLIRYKDWTIHIDPGYGNDREWQQLAPIAFDAKASLVLITHGHYDHVRPEALRRLIGPQTIVLAPFGAIDEETFPHRRIEVGAFYEVGPVQIGVIDAYNTPSGHSTKKYHEKGVGVGYVLHLGTKRIYHSGDTDVIPDMEKIHGVDVALLPVSGVYVMDVEEAASAAAIIRPGLLLPMHEMTVTERDVKQLSRLLPNQNIAYLRIGQSVSI